MTKASGWHRKRLDTPAEKARDAKYDSRPGHRNLRAQYAPLVAAGLADCWRCTKHIAPGTPWQLGHNDAGDQVMGPEHRACNLKAAASKGARIANAKRKAAREAARFVRPVR